MKKLSVIVPCRVVSLKARARAAAVPAIAAAMSALAPVVAHAAEAGVTTDVSGAIDIFTKGLALFSEYPMNLYIGGSLLCMGLGVFGVAKHAARR